jgi:hypothetical protein
MTDICSTGMLDSVCDEADGPAALAHAIDAVPRIQPLPLHADVPAQDAASIAADKNAAANPAESVDYQQGRVEASLTAAIKGSSEQQASPTADEAIKASSRADSDYSSTENSSPADAAAPAVPSSQDAAARVDDAVAAESEAASGPRRRRWRRVTPRREAAHATPPGTAPPSPQQRSPSQHSPAQLTGDYNDPMITLKCPALNGGGSSQMCGDVCIFKQVSCQFAELACPSVVTRHHARPGEPWAQCRKCRQAAARLSPAPGARRRARPTDARAAAVDRHLSAAVLAATSICASVHSGTQLQQ